MKVLDLLLISLAGYCLVVMSHELMVFTFKHANDWIPSVFSDAVEWQPGEVFHWALAGIVMGFLLVRFASEPIIASVLVALALITKELFPLVNENGITATLSHTISSYEMALTYYTILGLFPVITWLISLVKTPSREREVFRNDR